MILSASRRTDIPGRFAPWLMNRLRAGSVLVRNPMNHSQLSRIPLSPDTVDCIVFWTKDPAPLLPYLDELDAQGWRYYFQFTLTPYGRALERGLRPKAEIEETFITLARRLGRRGVVWRYDPILFTDGVGLAYHKAQFARLCAKLAPYTDTVVVSFVDLYAKMKTPAFRAPLPAEQEELAAFIGETAASCGLRAAACCEAGDLSRYGIGRSACVDAARIADICGCPVKLGADKNQRPGCGCAESVDIGAYNTCPNGCVYCYAAASPEAAARRYAQCDPDSEILFGVPAEGESITERKVRSAKTGQLTLL